MNNDPIEELKEYFKSSNDIPVKQAVIKRELYERIIEYVQELKGQAAKMVSVAADCKSVT